ncbi:MAG TPA: cysteine desulfurase-like protein [Gemmatimonadaceae bacterium]|nr:cysteine desulfurase-like protein [Gemmatimonadaceae bacterium]
MTSATLAAGASVAGVEEVRSHFPALERRHEGHPVAYFDGPGGTQVPRAVPDAMGDYLLRHNANTHWSYPTSRETDEMIAAARQALADFLNASPTEIAFGANMTTLTFHLARALGRSWGPGDEVIVTELDHHANIAPWRALEQERGVRVRVVRLDLATARLDWADLERALGPRTRLLAIGAASNALGTITDVSRAAQMARSVGALTFVDAVHYAPHVLVDVRAMDCDFLSCSAYKFYGPHIGVLYGREGLVRELDVPKLAPAPNTAPERLETGTQNHEGIAGAAAAVDFLASLGGVGDSRRERLIRTFAQLHARASLLAAQLRAGLDAIPGVTRYGPPDPPYTPTVAFAVRGVPAETVVRRLTSRGVFATHGDFYATTVVERLGHAEHGLVRAGAACYTTEEEVGRLIGGVEEIAR